MATSEYRRIIEAIALLVVTLGHACVGQISCGPQPPVGAGLVSSPNYQQSVSQITCQWILQPAPGKELYVAFDDFDLGANTRLEIYSGSSPSLTPANLITTYFRSGPTAAVDTSLQGAVQGTTTSVLSFAGSITMRYVNLEWYYPARGFQLHYYSDAPPAARSNDENPTFVCGSTQSGGAGVVQSPGYPGLYPINTKCTWEVKSCDLSSSLRISFVGLSLENSFDWVRLYSLLDKTETLIAEYTGSTLPATLDVAASLVSVKFSSDNIRSTNTGFAFKYATLLTPQNTPTDPLIVERACDGMCPKFKDTTYKYCTASDDPHMTTFCGKAYELQEEGVFYLYKHPTSPISVQAAFQHCSPGSYPKCLCAVAVRLCNELFVVDRCLTKSGLQPNRVYKAGNGALMQIVNFGAGWQVTLPNGMLVEIGGNWPIGYVSIRDPASTAEVASGVCNCNFELRCGTKIDDISVDNPSWYNSWRVQPGESLFTAWSSASPSPCDVTTCGKCNDFSKYPLPVGVADGNVQPHDQFSDSSLFSFAPIAGRRRRALPDGPVSTSSWTREATVQYCTMLFAQHPALQLCQSALAGRLTLNRDVDNCVRDILYTNTTSFAHIALTTAKAQCLQQLETANVSSSAVLALICPSDCTGHGSCVNGTCVCSSGWLGADCSQDASQVPVLTATVEPSSCPLPDVVSGVCIRQVVFGTPYFSAFAGYPVCTITSVSQAAPGGVSSTPSTTTVAATSLSVSSLSCRLPAGAAGQTVTYTIRVTNNGINYSNAVTTTRVFPSACGQTVSGSGFVTSPNYPLPYSNNALCVYSLTAAEGKTLSLIFNNFNVENSFDFVRVYDEGRLVDTFTGVVAAGLRKVYGGRLGLVFSSDNTVPASGFNISVTSSDASAQCGGSLSGSGTITSPGNYPVSYANNAYCIWSLTPAASGQSLRLHFDLFDLESGYDFLRLYVGGSLARSYSGAVVPTDATYSQPVYLVFTSDPSASKRGFSLSFASVASSTVGQSR